MQDNECAPENNHTLMYRVIDKPCYLIWWILSDRLPGITSNCEIMARLVCNASLLKDHDYRLKNKSFSHKICNNCELGLREDVNHMVMQCPHSEDAKGEMLEMIGNIEDEQVNQVIQQNGDLLSVLMGKHPDDAPFETMVKIWAISSKYIANMYRRVTRTRQLLLSLFELIK